MKMRRNSRIKEKKRKKRIKRKRRRRRKTGVWKSLKRLVRGIEDQENISKGIEED